MSLAAGTRLGPYEVLSQIGAGGMGEVYRARDTRLDRSVAIKVLPAELSNDPHRRARFEREARVVAALSHPHICTLYDVGEQDGTAFLVMELLEGQTLKQLMSRRRLGVGEMIAIALDAADGLESAHARGIIHRDVKPANIFITRRGQAKILDFGLAKAAPEGPAAATRTARDLLTDAGTAVGTVAYMSPEQALGQDLDARTDLFSLGVVLYEMATGDLPFRGDTSAALFDRLLHQAPTSLTRLNPDVPEALARIVDKALEKNRDVRYQSAREMSVDLQRLRRERQSGPVAASGIAEPPRTPSLAVLPFANLSADKENEYFSDGLAEDIIDALTQVPGLRVMARTSAFAFRGKDQDVREVGARLNVEHILEGSVRRAGNRVRVTAQLVKSSDGYHLWSQRFDREMTDIFAIQDEISQAIVEKLRVRLAEDRDLTRRRAVDPDAFQLYLKGQYYWNKTTLEGVLKGMECFQHAIDKDPSYALAYSWLSHCYSMLGVNYRPPHETFPKGKALALRALELDSAIAEPHVSIAAGQIFYDWDWAGAGYHLDRAIALSPSYAFAHNLKAYHSELMGRPDEAMSEITRAQELDPLALVVNLDVGVRHYFARRYDRAIEQFQGVREIEPNTALVPYFLWLACEQQGDYGRALAELQRLSPAAAGPETGSRRQGPLTRESYMAAVWEERPRLQELRDRRIISAGDVAAIDTSLGETDLAFEWLEKAYQDRESRLPWIKLDPRFDALRADARFEGLLRRMNLHP